MRPVTGAIRWVRMPSTSSPPSPSISEPPRSASSSGTSACNIRGQTTPCSSSRCVTSGPTRSSSPPPRTSRLRVLQPEMAYDHLLPSVLIGGGRVGEDPGHRNRIGQPISPRHVGGDGQHRRCSSRPPRKPTPHGGRRNAGAIAASSAARGLPAGGMDESPSSGSAPKT